MTDSQPTHASLDCLSTPLQSNSKGLAVPYESLVDDVLDLVVPGHFGVPVPPEERQRMAEVSAL